MGEAMIWSQETYLMDDHRCTCERWGGDWPAWQSGCFETDMAGFELSLFRRGSFFLATTSKSRWEDV